MAYWDSKKGKIVGWPTEQVEEYPGWEIIDCGCCNGLEWGGEYPRTCNHCGGDGSLWHHKSSGVLADYPGGPLRGKK